MKKKLIAGIIGAVASVAAFVGGCEYAEYTNKPLTDDEIIEEYCELKYSGYTEGDLTFVCTGRNGKEPYYIGYEVYENDVYKEAYYVHDEYAMWVINR